MPTLPFGLSSNPGRFGHDGDARLINCYRENAGRERKTPLPIYAVEGLTEFVDETATAGACRGLEVMSGELYALMGNELYKVQTSGSTELIGGIAGTDNVFMSQNQKAPDPQLTIVGTSGTNIVESGTIAPFADGDMPQAGTTAFLNGVTLYSTFDDSGRVFWSDTNESGSVDALNFVTAEGNPDSMARVVEHRLEAWFFGERSIEVFRDTGNSTNRFVRLSGAVIQRGCAAAHSIVKMDNSLVWLGDDLIVYRADGYTPKRISNHALEEALRDCTDISGITAFHYSSGGHSWYVIQCATFTWVYDASTQLWHERKSYNMNRWRAQHYVKFGDLHIVGDSTAGRLYKIDDTAHDENSNHLVWEARTPPMHAYPGRFSCKRLFLDFLPGRGLNSTDTHLSDPQIMLDYSDDGGKSWSETRQQSLGQIGEFDKTVRFSGLGTTGRIGRIWRVRVSAAVARALMGASVEGSVLGA